MTFLVTLDREQPVLPSVADVDWQLAGAMLDELEAFARLRLAKARLPKAIATRNRLLERETRTFRAELGDYFGGLLSRAGIAKADRFAFDPDSIDWDDETAELTAVIRRLYVTMGDAAYAAAAKELGIEISFDLDANSTAGIRDAIATKVTGITDRTRQVIVDYVETSIERGYSIDQLVNGVDDDGFLGLGAIFADRAQTIALTETATAYNLASSAGWRESGLVEQVLIFDGDECGWTFHDDPDLADGSIRDLDDFDDYPISHPNCQRAAGPVVADGSDA
jgi:hypothetical protein